VFLVETRNYLLIFGCVVVMSASLEQTVSTPYSKSVVAYDWRKELPINLSEEQLQERYARIEQMLASPRESRETHLLFLLGPISMRRFEWPVLPPRARADREYDECFFGSVGLAAIYHHVHGTRIELPPEPQLPPQLYRSSLAALAILTPLNRR
jgi:hypothetical protein